MSGPDNKTADSPEGAALEVVGLARSGRFAEIRDRFVPDLRPMVTAAALAAAWDAELGRHGPLVLVGAPARQPAPGGPAVVHVPLRFERGELNLVVAVTRAGQLTGLQLAAVAGQPAPAWLPPGYADPGRFDEQDVTLGPADLTVPGTLTLPRAPGPLPALVLLGGSGPIDRDGTVGQVKPYKDLAWGLASRGVAVLRLDKVTYARPDQVAADEEFTLADEYLPHARAAVRLLAAHSAVDPGRIFLGGHSLGGTVAPRVAAAEPSVAGLVILAGGTTPLHWSIVRQLRYIASLDPATAAASQPALDAVTARAERVDRPDLSPGTPADELPFGVPAPYWLDLRGYDPVATAAALGKAVLICQGGRDYQVTVTDDLARWRAGLDGHPGVTIRLYPADNHFFQPGTGPSSPAEVLAPGHVDPALVSDVADWLTG